MPATRDDGGSNAEYVPLMTVDVRESEHNEHDINDIEELKNNGYISSLGNQRTPLSPLTTASLYSALTISLLAFFLSSLSFWSYSRSPSSHSYDSSNSKSAPASNKDIANLRRPSLYLGLERVPEIRLRLEAEALLASLRPAPEHGDDASDSDGHGHGHGSMEGDGTPHVDGMVLPSAYARLSRMYPDMNWTDENVVLSEVDSMVLYFPLPVHSGPTSQCTFRASFPTRSALDGRLLTIEGKSPSLTLSEVVLPRTFHGSALGELTWNKRPTVSRALGSIPVAFGTMNETIGNFDCPRERVILQVDLNCKNGNDKTESVEGCRVEFRGSDISDTFGIALFI